MNKLFANPGWGVLAVVVLVFAYVTTTGAYAGYHNDQESIRACQNRGGQWILFEGHHVCGQLDIKFTPR